MRACLANSNNLRITQALPMLPSILCLVRMLTAEMTQNHSKSPPEASSEGPANLH